jgi:hypothetical protein
MWGRRGSGSGNTRGLCHRGTRMMHTDRPMVASGGFPTLGIRELLSFRAEFAPG